MSNQNPIFLPLVHFWKFSCNSVLSSRRWAWSGHTFRGGVFGRQLCLEITLGLKKGQHLQETLWAAGFSACVLTYHGWYILWCALTVGHFELERGALPLHQCTMTTFSSSWGSWALMTLRKYLLNWFSGLWFPIALGELLMWPSTMPFIILFIFYYLIFPMYVSHLSN